MDDQEEMQDDHAETSRQSHQEVSSQQQEQQPSGFSALWGDEEEEEEESEEEDFQQYRSAADLDPFALHRAAEEGDEEQLKLRIKGLDDKAYERRDYWGLTPLHTSIFACKLPCFLALLEWTATSVESKCQGSPVPHVILSVASVNSNQEFALGALQGLLDHGHIPLLCESLDEYERTPLRLACELGLEIEFIRFLLSVMDRIPDEMNRKMILEHPDRIKKWNVLHVTANLADSTKREEILSELLQNKILSECVNSLDDHLRTSLHIVVKQTGIYSENDPCISSLLLAGVDTEIKDCLGKKASEYYVQDRKSNKRERRGNTIIYSHETCSEHFTAPRQDTLQPYYSKRDVPPENVNRLLVLLNERFGTLRTRKLMNITKNENKPNLAELGDVLRVHEWSYISEFKSKCEGLSEDEIGDLDGDTTFSSKTYAASLIACGSGIEAVNAVVTGKCENAFCAVRPPGHHAGPSGVVPDCTSHGFCFLNNIAIAAAYALDVHRDKIKRVAIVDFDVHHGNGTEVCVENLLPTILKSKVTLPLPLGGELTLARSSWKPWLGANDSENVLFTSVHGFGKAIPGLDPDLTSPPFLPSFYPGSGKNAGWTDANIIDYGQNSTSRLEWRRSWRDIVLPRVAAFQPDMIFISAGFDAHAKDSINSGFCGALEQDYEWITQRLVAIANETCEGRIVSILEGGYRIQGMCVSAFARSVAEHVRVLSESSTDYLDDPEEIEWDRKEEEKLMEAEKNSNGNMQTKALLFALSQSQQQHQHHDHTDHQPNLSDDSTKTTTTNTGEENRAEPPIVHMDVSDRPKRNRKEVDFVKLNEEFERDREAKRLKALEKVSE